VEAPICQHDTLSREVCCLPGARIRNITKRLPSLVQSTDYYPLLLFHMGMNHIGRRSLRNIKKDYKSLGAAMMDSEAQVVFSSVLLIKGKEFERASRI